jgi:hypothetical protein
MTSSIGIIGSVTLTALRTGILSITLFSARRSNCGVNYLGVIERSNRFLRNEYFTTHRAFLSFGKSCFGTSRFNFVDYFFSVSCCLYGFLFYLAARARSAFFTSFGASRLGSYCPLAPRVNVRLGLIVALIGFFVSGLGFISGFRFVSEFRCFCGGRWLCRLVISRIAC